MSEDSKMATYCVYQNLNLQVAPKQSFGSIDIRHMVVSKSSCLHMVREEIKHVKI